MAIKGMFIFMAVCALSLAACDGGVEQSQEDAVDVVAKRYLTLALQWNEIDKGYVDAYYGPDELKKDALSEDLGCSDEGECVSVLRNRLRRLAQELESVDKSTYDPAGQARMRYLSGQFLAMETRMRMKGGDDLTFDEESKALYGAMAPRRDALFFQRVLNQINDKLPGDGPLPERVQKFRGDFAVPKDRLSIVFDAAIAECKKRSGKYIELPEGERFVVEYVSDKPWSGYNWYQGQFFSVIQVNTDFPLYIDRAVDLGCHEGYPGHHAYNVLLEKSMVRERGWTEFSLYPLFSPQSLIAEGSANYGIEMAFPGDERLEFEKNVLFPLAGLDKGKADLYYEVNKLLGQLSYAGNEAARHYLNGDWSAEQAQQWLVNYQLSAPDRANQRVSFFDTYRSYVINYNLGKDIVAEYIVREAGADSDLRWEIFEELLASPKLPADLIGSE
ncbi:MAG: hypothetical protein AAF438_22760 [Pseudomonadota bacterium]